MSKPWTKLEDRLFYDLVESGTSAEEIAIELDRDINDLKHRAYTLGLPRKWFKTPDRVAG